MPRRQVMIQAMTRVFTGSNFRVRGYVFNRTSGKVIEGCGHHHRKSASALACARRMVRRYIKEHPELEIAVFSVNGEGD